MAAGPIYEALTAMLGAYMTAMVCLVRLTAVDQRALADVIDELIKNLPPDQQHATYGQTLRNLEQRIRLHSLDSPPSH